VEPVHAARTRIAGEHWCLLVELRTTNLVSVRRAERSIPPIFPRAFFLSGICAARELEVATFDEYRCEDPRMTKVGLGH
jgi:hypothetical protein